MQNWHHINCSSQCGGHILYCSKIRKKVTENRGHTDREQRTDRQATENRQTEKAITEATLIVDGLPG